MIYRFESPEFLNYLFLLLILIPLIFWSFKLTSSAAQKLFKKEIFEILTYNSSPKKKLFKTIIEVIVIILLVLSLARPQSGESTEKIKMEGIELIFALDLSNSMLSEDVKPSRLDLAKRTINKLLDRFTGFKVGIIGFAGSAVVLSPLTTDYSALRLFLETAHPDILSSQGTNFSEAFQFTMRAFEKGGLENDEFSQVAKALVVISDGEDHEQGALNEAQELAKKGVRIFSMGVGTTQGGPIPIRDDFGNLKGYRKSNGETIISKVNVSFLQELAKKGQGSYNHITFDAQEVLNLEKDLNKLEKSEFESDFLKKFNEDYSYPLSLALILLLIEMLMPERNFRIRRSYS